MFAYLFPVWWHVDWVELAWVILTLIILKKDRKSLCIYQEYLLFWLAISLSLVFLLKMPLLSLNWVISHVLKKFIRFCLMLS